MTPTNGRKLTFCGLWVDFETMKRSRHTYGPAQLLALVLLVLVTAPGLTFAAPGDPVPAFDLIDLAGNRHTADDYEGQILLLFFVGHN